LVTLRNVEPKTDWVSMMRTIQTTLDFEDSDHLHNMGGDVPRVLLFCQWETVHHIVAHCSFGFA
jgi:hypothetical protein